MHDHAPPRPGLSPFASANTGLPRLLAGLSERHYRFVTVTPATHHLINARPENFWARTVADVFGWSRPFQASVLDPDLFDLATQAGVLTRLFGPDRPAWRSTVRVSALHDALFVHSAFPTSAADAVFFGPDTYRFAASIARHLAERGGAPGRAIDIGCGAGAAGILMARAAPQASIVLADINPAALVAARANAIAARVQADCRHSDVFDGVDGGFDMITANPPYLLDPSERVYRHGGGALGEGLSLRILREGLARLNRGGSLLLYTGSAIIGGSDGFYQAASAVLAGGPFSWRYEELDPDVFGEELAAGAYAAVDRIAAVVLTVRRPA